METITDYMSADHRRCDDLFVAAEKAVSSGDWESARSAYQQFRSAIEHHFSMEEQALFPTFEEVSGNTMGPTQVMRYEHEQMRALFADMAESLDNQDGDGFLGNAETLLVMMQQHNRKEEQILYPMADQTLAPQREELLGRMQEVEGA